MRLMGPFGQLVTALIGAVVLLAGTAVRQTMTDPKRNRQAIVA